MKYTFVYVEFLGHNFKVKFLGLTYTWAILLDMLLMSQVECGIKKNSFTTSINAIYKHTSQYSSTK